MAFVCKFVLGKLGLLVSRLWELYDDLASSDARILMLGLDGAGKTTLLYKLKLNQTIEIIPTIGFNVEVVRPVPGLAFTVWDLGGGIRTRPLWRNYFPNNDGLLYVVDSSDRKRMAEARKELFSVLDSDDMIGVPVVILANKQDRLGALTPVQITDQLHLADISDRKWYMQPICATSGEGIAEGLHQLAMMVKEFKNIS